MELPKLETVLRIYRLPKIGTDEDKFRSLKSVIRSLSRFTYFRDKKKLRK